MTDLRLVAAEIRQKITTRALAQDYGANGQGLAPKALSCPLCQKPKKRRFTLRTGGGFLMPEPQHPADVTPDDRIHKAPPSDERADFRSRTPRGFARAVVAANSAKERAAA